LCEVTCGESEHAYMPCLSRHAHFCGYEGWKEIHVQALHNVIPS
jgi:hypothetical protein